MFSSEKAELDFQDELRVYFTFLNMKKLIVQILNENKCPIVNMYVNLISFFKGSYKLGMGNLSHSLHSVGFRGEGYFSVNIMQQYNLKH